jgi:hypothetical protein
MDLPGSGYADKLDHQLISPITLLGDRTNLVGIGWGFNAHSQHNAPILDFYQRFILGFIEALNLRGRLKAVIGGSLGGNMAFRLGRDPQATSIPAVVAWSPGSIWKFFADGADPAKHNAVRVPWERAGGSTDQIQEEDHWRKDFFQQAFDATTDIAFVNVVPAQPDMWYRHDWPCLAAFRVFDRLDRQETYTQYFRLWHWRLAAEQLIYTHQAGDNWPAQYLRNTKPMPLACGIEDHFEYANICPATRFEVAPNARPTSPAPSRRSSSIRAAQRSSASRRRSVATRSWWSNRTEGTSRPDRRAIRMDGPHVRLSRDGRPVDRHPVGVAPAHLEGPRVGHPRLDGRLDGRRPRTEAGAAAGHGDGDRRLRALRSRELRRLQ